MRLNKMALACLVLGGSALMSACGGGGGGSDTTSSTLSLKGTAARGNPAAGGAVVATCKSGVGAATSNVDGTFTVAVANGVGPCLLTITQAGFAPMYSFTTGTDANQTANITPLTSILVNYFLSVPGMTANSAAAWFALPATIALLSNPAAVNTRIVNDFIPAIKLLVPTLALKGTDFLSTSFVAAPGGSSTDADLELLVTAQIVSATGVVVAEATASLVRAAANDTPAPAAPNPTGSTGAGS